jgi:hypothetical protein
MHVPACLCVRSGREALLSAKSWLHAVVVRIGHAPRPIGGISEFNSAYRKSQF